MNYLASLVVVASLSLCALGGCGSSECPAGQHREGGACVPNLQCGPGTKASGASCVPDTAVVCAKGTSPDGGTCVPDVVCGMGTHAVAGKCVLDPDPVPPTTWTKNQRVSAAGKYAAEPSVAADADGHVFVAFMEETPDSSIQTVLYVSNDHGGTFGRVNAYPSSDGFSGDVSVSATPDGKAYLAFIDYHQNRSTSQYPPADVHVVASADHGATWGNPVTVNVDNGSVFNDRPWVTGAPNNVVHIHWTGLSNAFYARSTNGGQTFGAPVAIQDPGQTTSISYSGHTVTPDGTILIPAQLFDNSSQLSSVGYWRSVDGQAFSLEPLADVYYTRDLALSASPVAATAPNGRTCLVYIDAPQRDLGINVAVSDDGQSFNSPMQPNDGKGTTQTFPWVAADAQGQCHILWYDNRSGDWEVWGVTVHADGTFSTTERVSDTRFPENGSQEQWLGDFISIAVGGDSRYAVWTDTREGSSEIFFASSPVAGPQP
jgi:hypothetical protein